MRTTSLLSLLAVLSLLFAACVSPDDLGSSVAGADDTSDEVDERDREIVPIFAAESSNKFGYVERVYAIDWDSSTDEYVLTAYAGVTAGENGHYTFTVEARAAVRNPVIGGTWKQRLQTAVIDYADTQYNLTVTDVLFPDLSILSL